MKKKVFFLLALTVLTLGFWVAATLYWGFLGPVELFLIVVIGSLLIMPLTMFVKKLNYSVWVYAGLLILTVWFLPAPVFVKLFPIQVGDPLGTPQAFTLLVIFSLALIALALLLNSGLRLYIKWQNVATAENSDFLAQRRQAGGAVALVFFLGVLLLARALYSLYWFMVWDSTGDGLGYLWLPIPILVVLSSTLILFIALPEKTKVAAFLFLLFIPAMITITAGSQNVDFHQLTETRAARLNQAIEVYYIQEGHYPQNIRQLTPMYLLSLSEPVIIFGQEWCYDAGDHYYRLGYIDREHWSAPHFIGHTYKLRGEVPDLYGICEKQALALQKRHPDFPYEYLVVGQ